MKPILPSASGKGLHGIGPSENELRTLGREIVELSAEKNPDLKRYDQKEVLIFRRSY